ncbi:metalloproteinase [Culex quinquefasciatus]|uniref:Metalloendopeptidase n=1 Tax=Culex quinquefasciatus TaxID=7176 RepID=B0W773_CULQU|nr:metalloproteinase [Culex quinquefasciatus]|eukprot:XP_001844557.1 metalloproteinase [Culex quinquefasciatus]
MLLQQRQLDTIRTGRQPVVTEVDRWINNVVPYVLDSEYLTNYHGQQVRQAMTQIEQVSSVRFVPKQHDVVDYLVISGEPTGGCWATLGRNRGLNRMNLATGECFSEGTIVHQLLHVLGFGHATNALDRDFHVDIDWDQVRPEHYEGLAIYPGVAMPDFGVPFDEDSIMNFGTTHFGRNDSVTIRVKIPVGSVRRVGETQRVHQLVQNTSGVHAATRVQIDLLTTSVHSQRRPTTGLFHRNAHVVGIRDGPRYESNTTDVLDRIHGKTDGKFLVGC